MENRKKIAVIVTVGTRDVHVDLSVLKEKFADKYNEIVNTKSSALIARKAGEFIRQNYSSLKQYIKIPIIKPTLDYLIHEAENIDYVLLVATDQESPRDTDTYHYAEIIKTYIANHYKNVQTEVFRITSNEVVYLDKMYNYFHGMFATNKLFKSLHEYENIYLHLVGGIDAINTAIRFNAIQKLGSKIQSELHVNEDTSTATPIQSVKQFLYDNDVNTVKKMLANYFYEGINELEFVSDNVKYFAQYAHYRMMFNFSKARHMVAKVSQHTIKDAALRELNYIADEKNNQAKLQELFWNVDIKYRQKNYVDFLLRFFRLIEEILVEEVLAILKIEYTENNWKEEFQKYLKTNSGLETWLENKRLNYLEKNPSTYLLNNILFYLSSSINPIYSKEDYEYIEKAYTLQQMRNKSIGAHSFEAPDEREIKRIYEQENLVTWLKQKTGIPSQEQNPYDRINEAILKLLN